MIDLGISLKPKKLVKGVATAAKKAGKLAVDVHKLPIQLTLNLALKAATIVSKIVCVAPEPVLRAGAVAAGVSYDAVPLFCTAIKAKNSGQIRAHLPQMIKLTAKLAATGAFPAAGPALQAIKYIPGLSQFAGTDDASELFGAMDTDQIGWALAGLGDDEIADALGISLNPPLGYGLGIGLGIIAVASGIFVACR